MRESGVPAVVSGVSTPVVCQACGRNVRQGRILELSLHESQPAEHLCLTCGRRALLEWADRRRREAIDARRLAQLLGEKQVDSGFAHSAA